MTSKELGHVACFSKSFSEYLFSVSLRSTEPCFFGFFLHSTIEELHNL